MLSKPMTTTSPVVTKMVKKLAIAIRLVYEILVPAVLVTATTIIITIAMKLLVTLVFIPSFDYPSPSYQPDFHDIHHHTHHHYLASRIASVEG